jgi:glycosyltransferase involved in cell wall biosynthesis
MHAPVREIYSRSFRILRSLPDLKLLVLVETAEVAQLLSDIAGPWLQIIILPYVAGYLDEIHTTRKKGRVARPVVGYVGQTRPERGALLIPEIAKKTLLAYPDSLAWRVQLNLDVIRRQVSQDLDGTLDWLAKSPAFEFVGSNLPIADYYNLLASIDIMVMPYSDRYDFTGSGIGVESLRLGHVQVVPERSSMARMIAAYQAGAVTFPEATVEKVTYAIIEALERFDELRERCMHAAKTAQAESGALFQLKRFIQDA